MVSQVLSGTERAVFCLSDVDQVAQLVSGYVASRAGSDVAEVLFRAGRIDAVWAVRTTDGRDLVVKAHRAPVDLRARSAAVRAQLLLNAAGFPCPEPVSGPDRVGDLVMSIETLTAAGGPADGRQPKIRRGIAHGLSQHIEILGQAPELIDLAGRGPAWCRYQGGPWPTPHDPIFDFTSTPDGYEWLDEFARDASHQIRATREPDEIVVGHADWYLGNLRFEGEALAATFDWDVVADTEAVIAGMVAGSFTASSTNGAVLPTPADAAAFLTDYDDTRARPFTDRQQQCAAGAAAWVIAYNARCAVSLLQGVPLPDSPVLLARDSGEAYLRIRG
ncbi:hypothetical protein GCM10009841_22010 [Microlunatus panaciterrae]|uniref:Aminoglycoside phosphotransferase domain-containing protein n=1 Tax=Microlunatus panaciterrae TaxID=400768 RepID=A0ABS2RDS9_9ACTN|nr:phosphotransferase [Microlunatus panaciterrae]MBM7797087.1 hypothetical protein [Microlunatus panaciterrae]